MGLKLEFQMFFLFVKILFHTKNVSKIDKKCFRRLLITDFMGPINPLQPRVAYLYPLMFSGGIDMG